jgi:hypothetical protein
MPNGYGLNFKKAVAGLSRSFKKACGATKKNQELVIPAFSYSYPAGAGASQIVAVYTVPIVTPWTIRYPITRPSTSFVAVLRWVTAGVTYRYKLWSGVGEILPLPTYIGETIPSGAALEIWTASANPAVLSTTWRIPLGILENPSTPCDTDGTDISPSVCVPPFTYGTITSMLAHCAL